MSDTRPTAQVVAFPQERIQRSRTVDVDAVPYVSQVSKEMREMTGLKYLQVRKTLHGDDREFVRDALDRGVSAKDFADFTVRSYGLKTTGIGNDQATVEDFNNIRVAILEFADEMQGSGWERGLQGSVIKTMKSEDGTVHGASIMQPVLNTSSGRYGFVISVFDASSFDDNNAVTLNAKPTANFAGFDLEDALAKYDDYEANLTNDTVLYRR